MRKVIPITFSFLLLSIALIATFWLLFFSASIGANSTSTSELGSNVKDTAFSSAIVPAAPNFSVTTRSYNNFRTSSNLFETTLNTSNVVSSTFGRLFVRQVDGQIYAQPLYMPNVSIPNVGVRNIVYVATERNKVYAFDADDPLASTAYWQVYLGPPATTPTVDFGGRYGFYKDIVPNVGVTGTPVIDPATSTMYVSAFVKRGGQYYHELSAIDIQTGQKKKTVSITGSVAGTGGDGNIDNDPNTVTFDPKQHIQRPALTLLNNNVYIAFAGYADTDPYHGWIMAYDKTTLAQTGIFNVTPSGNPATQANGGEGGIWMSGQGLAVGEDGSIYLVTGNGTVTADSGGKDYGNSVLKLNPALGASAVVTWFIPYNYATLNLYDNDLGVGGVVVLPGTTATNGKSLILSGSKEGKLYILYRDALGGNCPTSQCNDTTGDTNVYQTWLGSGNNTGARHIHGSPVWWDGPGGPYLYIWNENDYGRGFKFNKATGFFNTSQSVTLSTLVKPPDGMPGGIMSLSANGNISGTGILWALNPLCGDANPTTRPGILRAFDATDLRKELWNSEQAGTTPGTDPCKANDPNSYTIRDRMGYLAKFNVPMVANGKVYVGTFSDQLVVYGLYTQTNVVNWMTNDANLGGSYAYATSHPTPDKTIYFVPPKNGQLTLSITDQLNFADGTNLVAECGANGSNVIFDGQNYTGNRPILNLGSNSLVQGIQFWRFPFALDFSQKAVKLNCVKVNKT